MYVLVPSFKTSVYDNRLLKNIYNNDLLKYVIVLESKVKRDGLL